MPGVVVILIALLIFPVIAIMGSVTVAIALGWALNRDAADRHEGSELVEVNY